MRPSLTGHRNAARELAFRCDELVNTIKEDAVNRDPVSVQRMIDDLLQWVIIDA